MAFVGLLLGSFLGCTAMDKALIDPQTGKAKDGNVVTAAGNILGSLPIPFAGLIGAAVSAFPGIYAAFRGKQWKNAALATASAAGNIVRGLPDSKAKTDALKALDVVHDAAGVADALQTTLQDTAAAHAGVAAS